MTNMKLTNKIVVTKKYDGKSKFPFWENIKEGDMLEVSLDLKPTGHGYGGRTYAPTISIKNISTDEIFKDTINSFQKYLGKISYKE